MIIYHQLREDTDGGVNVIQLAQIRLVDERETVNLGNGLIDERRFCRWLDRDVSELEESSVARAFAPTSQAEADRP